ncbi:MAG: hypothetical protein HY903_11735 [Deltaproteobacteria bacterium]|nr:hypothetical protein [Deltaproteobacteria bacterium]
MYLVTCTQCHTSFSKEARICPKCGYMRRHVAAPCDATRRDEPAVVMFGEATWWRRWESL